MASTTPPDTPALLRPGLDFLPDDYGKFSAEYNAEYDLIY